MRIDPVAAAGEERDNDQGSQARETGSELSVVGQRSWRTPSNLRGRSHQALTNLYGQTRISKLDGNLC